MDKRYQIFISSTYKDLIVERQKVTQAILGLYHLPIGMEMFHADNEEQWYQIKNTIDMSDYYILIVGRCCGTLIDSEGISYTEKEYNYALSKNIPILSFVISDTAKKESYGDESVKQQRALKKFIKKVKKLPCEFWNTPEELAYQVSKTLSMKFREDNRSGWIKNEINNLYNIMQNNFYDLNDEQINDIYRKVFFIKLLKDTKATVETKMATNNLIEKQLAILNNQKTTMDFYIKDYTRNIEIGLYDEYIEIVTFLQYVFRGNDEKEKEFRFFPWLYPGLEENTYEFIDVKYNAVSNQDYIKKGNFKQATNELYVTGGIGISIPYDKNVIEHNITYKSRYHTEYAKFFHSYIFKKYCEHFCLSAILHDYRNSPKEKYLLKWEMFTPNQEYGYNSKRKISQTDTEIRFSPIEWMVPSCGYIITINKIC